MLNKEIVARIPVFDIMPSTQEQWSKQKPMKGDHIRVLRSGGLYAHHGVYISDEEVIHFAGVDDDCIFDWSKVSVICTNLQHFVTDGTVEIKIYTEEEKEDLYPVEHIVSYARSCLGDDGYDLAFNNCEHFANVCTLGRFRSYQVERVLKKKMPNDKEDTYMGLFGKIGGFVKGLFGGGSGSGGGSRSSSNTTTTYEPDKVKIAEIEADAKIRLAHMEADKVELIKQAQIDLLEAETQAQIAVEQARAQGFTAMAQTIVILQERLNEITEKRIQIIEHGSLSVIKEMENFYKEMEERIEADNDLYSKEKFPALLAILDQYEAGSVPYNLYIKRIETDMEQQAQHNILQLSNLSERQNKIIDGFLASKEKILEQTGSLTESILEKLQIQQLELHTDGLNRIDINGQLEQKEKLLLSEVKEQ